MKGDFSRRIFDPKKHYRNVLMQQGRVQLDADANEQADITSYQVETRMHDLVGGCGGPMHNAAFGITPGASPLTTRDLTLSAGRYYVDGILCENEAPRTFFTQPDLPLAGNPDATLNALGLGFFIAYLDVWQRHLTALDDPQIREVALGGPDTTTRVKTVWQVKLARIPSNQAPTCLAASEEYNAQTAPSGGMMKALQAAPPPGGDNLCIVPPGAGYQGLENQLYRVEVHTGGALGTATFKWSRDNGAVVTTVERINAREVTVRDLGPDAVLGFDRDQWVEISDDVREFRGLPGELRQIEDIDPARRVIILKTAPTPLASNSNGVAPQAHPKLRRWDHTGAVAPDGALRTASTTLDLEHGVQVSFSGSNFRVGDYWLIPARTASADAQSGNIEWPRNEGGVALSLPPRGIRHHYCKIAVLQLTQAGFTLIRDCRSLFPPVTELTQLFYAGGDGQEVMPVIALPGGPAPGERLLPAPLAVGVSNGRFPVRRARVRFQTSTGTIMPGTRGQAAPQGGNLKLLEVTTDINGLADCRWNVSSLTQHDTQTLTATLLDVAGQPTVHIPITFTASLRRASGVSYQPGECDDLGEVKTVQEALDELCKRKDDRGACSVTVGEGGDYPTLESALKDLLGSKRYDICICMLAGRHTVEHFLLREIRNGVEFNGTQFIDAERRGVRLKIEGCGAGTQIVWQSPPDRQFLFTTVAITSFILRDVEASIQSGHLDFGCRSVVLESCFLSQTRGFSDDEALSHWQGKVQPVVAVLRFDGCNHVRVVNCHVGHFLLRRRLLTFEPFIEVHPPLATLYADVAPGEFNQRADALAREINDMPTARRAVLATRVSETAQPFVPKAIEMFKSVAAAIQAGNLRGASNAATGLKGHLAELRSIEITPAQASTSFVREGTAVIVTNGRMKATLHDNLLDGTLCLYGDVPS
ncbi:MAG TPA: DUF6519 domain-containing protein, partial [Pyrinomonadaceae bacterium]